MPGFDRTGPMGAGPMSGGARGRCNPAMAGNIPASNEPEDLHQSFIPVLHF